MPAADTLAATLRAATAGSRDLDARIALAAGWTKGGPPYRPDWFAPTDYAPADLPPFTTDLTSIATLLRTLGYDWSGGTISSLTLVSKPGRVGECNNSQDDPTLALCTALAVAEGW